MPPAGRVTRGALAAAEDFASLSSRDRLIFAQAVYEYGARQSAWTEIAKVLSKHPLISKPKNFSTVQSCIAIYNYLMKEADIERTDLCEAKKSPIHAQLAQRFYRDRVAELRNQIATEEERFKTLVSQIEEIRAGNWDDRIRAKLGGAEVSFDLPPVVPAETPEATEPVVIREDAAPARTEGPTEDQQNDEVPVEMPSSDGEAPMDVSSPMRPSSPPPQESSPQQETPKAAEEHPAESMSTESELSPVPPASEEHPPTSPKHVPKTRSQTRKEPAETIKSPTPTPDEDEEMPDADEEVQEAKAEEEEMEEDAEAAPETSPDGVSPDQTVSRGDETTELVSREWTPDLQERLESKRRASDADEAESSRDRKRARDKSEPVETVESPAPATPSAIPLTAGTKDAKERKRFQSVILMLHAQITAHRNGTIFHNPIKHSEAPDYQDIVKRPMDLKTIKNRVKDGRISSSSEYQRDIYLMFANSLMYNRPNSDIYMMAEEMMQDSEAEIQNFQQTEAYNLRTRG
ncbi:hypothetical protein ACEPAG_6589 [Sanghuangporus baumii]